MATDAILQHDPMKQAARPAAPAMKVTPKTPAQVAKAPPPPPPKVEVPAPKPEPVAVALAQPAPAPVALAQPAPAPVAEPVKAVAEPVKPKAAAKPKSVTVKEKQAPAKTVAQTAKPLMATTSELMQGSGLKYNDLMTAVLNRDVAGVNELLKLGKWVDKPDSRGRTPLMVATAQEDVPTAEALLRGGASPRPAVRVAEERGNGEMVALLKRYGGR
jgi:hypothetical protein